MILLLQLTVCPAHLLSFLDLVKNLHSVPLQLLGLVALMVQNSFVDPVKLETI